ncbi:hypothetical protein [Salinispora arenicola]|uniref:hypothetical protein n=1 Tax=Salinispora arenicola TaxID=168697 RepID=UPI00037E8395|nr:hypothetical protein [Salinispora arenicola]
MLAECGVTDPLACVPGPSDLVASGVDALAAAIREGVAGVLKATMTWWIDVPPLDIEAEGTVVAKLRGYMWPMAVFVATIGVVWAGIRMTLSRKADPLIDVGRGLFVTALWTTLAGITLPAGLLVIADEWAKMILDSAAGGGFSTRMQAAITAPLDDSANSGLVIVLGLLAIIAGCIQAVLTLFREGALLILTGVVVLAAAGQFNPVTRPWLRKVMTWMLALIFYKPMAALVYATGFTLLGDGKGAKTMFMGFAVLIMSIIALPVLLKFFDWSLGNLDHSGGGMIAAAGAAGGALHAASWLGGGGGRNDSASDHARYMQQHGPATSGPSMTPAGATPAGGPAGPGAGGSGPPPQSPAPGSTAPTTASSAGTAAAAAAGPVGAGVAVGTAATKTAAGAAKAATTHTDKATGG